MSPGHYVPDHDFAPAPAGARVRLVTLLSFVGVLATTVLLISLHTRQRVPWPVFTGPVLALPILLIVWLTARVQGYRLAAAELQVHLLFRIVRFPLAGLQDAVPDRDALRGARKIIGNDGLGAISGRYKSKRLGRFQAYVTDCDHAIVLRWPDRCLVISPDQTAWFVENLRRHAGLSLLR